MSYELAIAVPTVLDWEALGRQIALPDLAELPSSVAGTAGSERVVQLHRTGLSTRSTEVRWAPAAEKVRIVVRALASPEDCDLALRVAEAVLHLTGARTLDADYFGTIAPADLRRLHNADWVNEQVISSARSLAALIRDGRGPLDTPGPRRSCFIGPRLLEELERAGPPAGFPERVLATLRRVQWDVPPGFRDAGVFVSGGRDGARETRFAVWLPDENLVIPRVDFVALRITEGEVLVVPSSVVATLAGAHAEPLDEVQLLVRAMSEAEWKDLVERARPHAKKAAK